MSRLGITLCVALVLCTPALARSPWTRAEGEGFVQLATYGIGPYDSLYQRSGDSFRTSREITERTIEAYGEYGITDRWTLVGVVPYRTPETGDLVPNPTILPTISSVTSNTPSSTSPSSSTPLATSSVSSPSREPSNQWIVRAPRYDFRRASISWRARRRSGPAQLTLPCRPRRTHHPQDVAAHDLADLVVRIATLHQADRKERPVGPHQTLHLSPLPPLGVIDRVVRLPERLPARDPE